MNPWRGMNQRLSPPPGRDRPIVVAFSELDRLEELARDATAERAEGWTTGPAISRLQDATPSGVILTLVSAARVAGRLLQEAGSEREAAFGLQKVVDAAHAWRDGRDTKTDFGLIDALSEYDAARPSDPARVWSERENPCCYSLHEFEQVCPRTGSTFRPDTVR